MMQAHGRFAQTVDEQGGKILGGETLQPTAMATAVRNDGQDVTAGPFVATREALGGFYLLEVTDRDQALAFCPVSPDLAPASLADLGGPDWLRRGRAARLIWSKQAGCCGLSPCDWSVPRLATGLTSHVSAQVWRWSEWRHRRSASRSLGRSVGGSPPRIRRPAELLQ
jgi:YCII-related domain